MKPSDVPAKCAVICSNVRPASLYVTGIVPTSRSRAHTLLLVKESLVSVTAREMSDPMSPAYSRATSNAGSVTAPPLHATDAMDLAFSTLRLYIQLQGEVGCTGGGREIAAWHSSTAKPVACGSCDHFCNKRICQRLNPGVFLRPTCFRRMGLSAHCAGMECRR
jgi:hypothetical protein